MSPSDTVARSVAPAEPSFGAAPRKNMPGGLADEQVGAAGYPMRPLSAPPTRLDRAARVLAATGGWARWQSHRYMARAEAVAAAASVVCTTAQGAAVGTSGEARMLAAVRAAASQLGMTPRPVQIASALAASEGCIVELPTGAGKTLAIAIAAAAIATRGIQVHVLTANDYLASRDAAAMTPLFASLGLAVASLGGESAPHERRLAHRAPIVYCSAREIVFDHLRDRQWIGAQPTDLQLHRLGEARRHVCLQGLRFALVDEADSVLLDEAGTPFVLAAQVDGAESADMDLALETVRRFVPSLHCEVRGSAGMRLLPAGRACAERELPTIGPWRQTLYRDELLALALTAVHDLERDRDYVVDAQGVRIVDPISGRCADGRRWSGGLHEMVERKEGIALGAGSRDRASITYQAFFQRYLRLGGMSGTAASSRRELAATYGLSTVAFAQPITYSRAAPRLWPTDAQRSAAIVDTVRGWSRSGRASLVATRTVSQSEAVAAAMRRAGLSPTVLNAKTESGESEAVRAAGGAGAITIATPLVGRGTDIALATAAERAGGLHVLIAFLPPSRRAERQLAGRAGRDGQPGHVACHYALDDAVTARHLPAWLRAALARRMGVDAWTGRIASCVAGWAQRRAEAADADARGRLPAQQHRLETALAFAGESLEHTT